MNGIAIKGREILACAAALCLVGCAAVGPNFRRPAATTDAGYAMAGDPAPRGVLLTADARTAGPWWRALGSAQLDTVMNQALAGNQTVAQADAALEKARRQADVAKAALKPQIDANAGLERERVNPAAFGFPGFPGNTFNLYSVGGTVSYDLDLFGGNRRHLEAERAMAQAQSSRADAAYLTLTGEVALEAVRIAGLRAELDAVRAVAADDQENIDIVRRAEAAGGEANSASSGGQAQLAQDQALAPPLAQQLSEARHALAVLVGKSPAQWSAPDFNFAGFSPPAQVPVSLPSSLVRNRPDILAAEADFHAATASIGVAAANLYPDVRLSAGLTQAAITPGALFDYSSTAWTLGAGLTAPIFHGGALRAAKAAAVADANASLALYRQTVLAAFGQVADVLAALAHDDDDVAALARAEAAASSSLDDARAAYRLGGGARLAIVIAQRQANRARLARVQAAGQRLIDIVKLFAATAADWR
ncbi:MAG TPA: efflux transporter outer membrane subunit [Caulobacteraceae bacterium]|nr:efflux transporter outer membrane subunit [Caulobacteraceae bacterium]